MTGSADTVLGLGVTVGVGLAVVRRGVQAASLSPSPLKTVCTTTRPASSISKNSWNGSCRSAEPVSMHDVHKS